MSRSTSPIPAFYYHFFTTLDPLISLSAIYMNFFSPETILGSAFAPSSPWCTVTPSHTMLMHQAGGAFAMFAFLMVFMLRATNDLKVWKYFEAGVLMTDGAAFWSLGNALASQRRLGVGEWRGEEWGTVVILVVVSVVRIAFLMGLGMEQRRVAKKIE
ncbi:hypothetical protein P153DRAFT_288345 [Dothidotthia symphoricarpi CBS 119687]|uniref:DUF7704 domain-containing protein n=1 Tax=Dothidotthia symphoricarpi CBS 119687 TaxID=1392245 RepID=A0A6A6AHG2_9PLEO|nr:uncharacterized protein P153DRAFT_288345 [Dothidotthia symphoricarpi CBS 119687]KAF2130327.1 hypothetical protein P153DRAFT_288345 [Dothidotthia symphoricarpi CBS 119687]